MRARRLIALVGVPLLLASTAGIAHADDVTNSLDNSIDNAKEVMALTVGGPASSTDITVIATKDSGQQTAQCNVSVAAPLVVNLASDKTNVATVSPSTLTFSACGAPQQVTVTPVGAGETNIDFTKAPTSTAGGSFELMTARFQAHVTGSATPPPPVNTKPSVSVTGAVNGTSYEIGSEPTPGCSVTDTQDGPSTHAAVVTGTLSHGLGQLTATCNYTDQGGLAADTKAVTYTIVDTGDPTINGSFSPPANAAGWHKTDVAVSFSCADTGGSGIQSCVGDTTLSSEGADQSVTGTATDWADNTSSVTVSGINIDKTAPGVGFTATSPADGGKYFPNNVPAAGCTATDSLSGVATCIVTGHSTALGTHTLTATATDNAGNTSTTTRVYSVRNLTYSGFVAPVDKGIHNTIKGGNTVPLKFRVFDEDVAQTATSVVSGFSAKLTACNGVVAEDAIEEFSTVASGLRYDAAGGHFIQNWKTPAKANQCYLVSVTLIDGTSISAEFKTK